MTVGETTSVEVDNVHLPHGSSPLSFRPTTDVFNENFADRFSETMVYGKHGAPMVEFLELDTLTKQSTHTYRQRIAQTLSFFETAFVHQPTTKPGLDQYTSWTNINNFSC